jgi:2-keto-4-pentenoate hydratase/2-oxohepta-3-ene-1,7-dioic acid hydratase in catechol pathway
MTRPVIWCDERSRSEEEDTVRLVRVGEAGGERPCVLREDGTAVDVSPLVGDVDGAFLEGGGVERLRREMASHPDLATVDTRSERVGPCVARPPKVVCIGLNYVDHAEESGQAVPSEPVVFFKAPNTVVGPYDDVRIPRGSEKTDWEVELGVVVGREARYLEDEAAAREVIAGYAVSHDVSERAFQLERGGQWVKGKSCETFNPLGPWLVTPEEVLDPQALALSLTLNGETVQRGSTAHMIFSVAHVVWYLSQFMVLEPGDLINTGTPAGVGMARGRYLRDGDVTELEITGLGRQRQRFVPAP